MARIWLDIMGINLQPWGIPQEILQELTQLVMEAQAALDAAPPTKRTTVLTAKVVAAFDKPEAKMRFIKEHYFLKPPRATAAAGSL
jgi:hypothetical protein